MATVETVRRPGIAFPNVYIWFALLIPAVFLAFGGTYFRNVTFSGKAMTVVLQVHAALMMLWVLMLIAQAWFIRTKRMAAHRWVGRSSYVIAPAIIVVALLAMRDDLVRAAVDGVLQNAQTSVFGFGPILAFAVCWGLAILYRRPTALHMRYMISTAFAISNAVVVRILIGWVPGFVTNERLTIGNWALLSGPLLVLIALDWRRGMKCSPFWVVTVLIGVMTLGFWTFASGDAWMAFCRWFAGMPS